MTNTQNDRDDASQIPARMLDPHRFDHSGNYHPSAADLDHCDACGFDLGTHHPTCPTYADAAWIAQEEADRRRDRFTQDTRESLASLMAGPDYYFQALMLAARTEAEGWHQY